MIKMWYPCASLMRGPRDTIILYVESCNAPLAVEIPDGGGVGVGASVGAAIGGVGASIGAAIRGAGAGVRGGAGAATGGDGLEEEFDWLNEGLEGEDFADDIFVHLLNLPSNLCSLSANQFWSQPLYNICSSSENFTTNDQYESNLRKLLGNLNYQASLGFGLGSVGWYPYQTYGLALCRGDVATTDCKA
ncbi:cysteine-rich repeat secretory protein 38 [Quercus suber]|uniref:Cysteine-rich repeat secretory protein 38 n=1 Tax=Quercus suber TaxID=58331 RepID=A0AAW0M5Z7_QUESU